MPAVSICVRKSGPQSMSRLVLLVLMMADVRVRLSRGSLLVHTWQLHPMRGMPKDVPVPRKRIIVMVSCDMW